MPKKGKNKNKTNKHQNIELNIKKKKTTLKYVDDKMQEYNRL